MTLINRTFLILLVSAILVVASSYFLQFFTLRTQTDNDIRALLFHHKKLVAGHFIEHDSVQFAEARMLGYDVKAIKAWTGPDTFFVRRTDDQTFMVYRTTINTGTHFEPVEIRKDMAGAMAFRRRLLLIHLYTLMAIVLAFVSIKLVAFNNIWGQLRSSLELLKRKELHKREVEFPRSNIKEINELNKELNELSIFLNREYHSQKEFIENLSHELFTPISNIRGKLELLIQSENLQEKDLQLIDKAMEGLDRLIRVNRSLIIMTKLENTDRIEKSEFRISDVVDQSLDLFEDQIRLHGLKVEKKIKEDIRILANQDMIEILVVNLLRNAIMHNVDEGFVQIRIEEGLLLISNTGRLDSLDSGQVFKRFNSTSEYGQSVGLGLAISQRICAASDIGISYRYDKGTHTFSLDLGHVAI